MKTTLARSALVCFVLSAPGYADEIPVSFDDVQPIQFQPADKTPLESPFEMHGDEQPQLDFNLDKFRKSHA